MAALDKAALKALVADRNDKVGPCNWRCASRGECAFGRAEAAGQFCREHRPSRSGKIQADVAVRPEGADRAAEAKNADSHQD